MINTRQSSTYPHTLQHCTQNSWCDNRYIRIRIADGLCFTSPIRLGKKSFLCSFWHATTFLYCVSYLRSAFDFLQHHNCSVKLIFVSSSFYNHYYVALISVVLWCVRLCNPKRRFTHFESFCASCDANEICAHEDVFIW